MEAKPGAPLPDVTEVSALWMSRSAGEGGTAVAILARRRASRTIIPANLVGNEPAELYAGFIDYGSRFIDYGRSTEAQL